MIVTRSPLRVSFLGGGTDYPEYFIENEGMVLGSAIDKNVFVFANKLPLHADQRIRFTYRKVESVSHFEDLEHPVLKAAIPYTSYKDTLNIATMADIQGNSGLGSSSAFTAATISSLLTLRGKSFSKLDLVNYSIDLERNVLNEHGGWQDQYFTVFGGLRFLRFSKQEVDVGEDLLNKFDQKVLSSSMLLVPIGNPRSSRLFAEKTSNSIRSKNGIRNLTEMQNLTKHVFSIIKDETNSEKFLSIISEAMNSAWELKKNFFNEISSEEINHRISELLNFGAMAVKLCGAGGSGYLLVITPFGDAHEFNNRFLQSKGIPFSLESKGCISDKLS